MNDIPFPNAHVKPDNGETVVWYEFLLDQDRLPEHLAFEDPEPSGSLLIKQFFEQANRPINDQGQILPPPDNQKNKLLKNLALRTAAILKWDLRLFERELPISCRHQLLQELLILCQVPSFPSDQIDIPKEIESMHDHRIMAIILYCRWAAHTVVKSSFPIKPSGRITPTVPPPGQFQANAQQRCDELKEKIVNMVKNQCYDIVQTLEAFLHHIKRPVYSPDYECIRNEKLCSEEENKGWRVSYEELHAQVCYDLGCLHFTHGFYDKANEMFNHVRGWMQCFPEQTSGYTDISEKTLQGYIIACRMVDKQQDVSHQLDQNNDSLYLALQKCIKDGANSRELSDILMKDIEVKELSLSYREDLERQLLSDYEGNNLNTYFNVIWSNAICRALRGFPQPTYLFTYELNLAQLQRILGLVQETCGHISQKETKKLGSFLRSLYNNLTKVPLQQQILQCEITRRCLSEKQFEYMKLRACKPTNDSIIIQDSPTSPEASATGQAAVAELERTLVMSFDPRVLKDSIAKLHKLSPGGQHRKTCDHWDVSSAYVTVLSSVNDGLMRDLMYVLLAKVNHCYADKDYSTIKSLLAYIQNNAKSISFKLHKISVNEMLKVELLELLNDSSLSFSTAKECQELQDQLSDILKRAKQHLLTASSDVVPSPSDLTNLCIAFLINLEDFASLESVSSQSSDNRLKFANMVSTIRSKLAFSHSMPDAAKSAALELWNGTARVFAASVYHQRRSQDGAMIISKLSDVPSSLISQPGFLVFVKKIRNCNILQIIVSMLVRLHRICQEDVLVDIKVDMAELWPHSLSGQHTVSGSCLANAMKEVLSYCLSINPHSMSWLRTQADVHFAYCNYPAAFRTYVMLGAVESNFYNRLPHPSVFDDNQLIHRMVKCCMQMKCNTQAAVLCQMMKEVDYSTAFKALQENRERTDAMELYYYDHFWDVQLLEYVTSAHRDSGETGKKEAALRALANPEINGCNTPEVVNKVANTRKLKFFRALARQYLC